MTSTTSEKHLVAPLLLAALMANFLLFAVSYSNASFSGYERALPSFGLEQITYQMDQTIDVVMDNFVWAIDTAYAEAQPKIVAFLGLEGYEFGQPRSTALASQQRLSHQVDAGTSQVLGVSIMSPLFYFSQ